jgi:aspartate carbamoyltransferase catalytic subunit
VQHERGSSAAVYGVTPEHMMQAKQNMLLMHPLPRLAELPTSLDSDPRSAYFRQMRNGLFMRMAILANVMKL